MFITVETKTKICEFKKKISYTHHWLVGYHSKVYCVFFLYRESASSARKNSDVVSYQNDTYSVETITPISCHPAIKEIIDTEEVYLNDLNITINEIKKSLMKEMVNNIW